MSIPIKKSLLIIIIIISFTCLLQIKYVNPIKNLEAAIVYIRQDGSIEPSNVPILKEGNTYKFEDDIVVFSVVIEKSSIIIDGNGHELIGPGIYNGSAGFLLNNLSDVIIKNAKITNFYWGIRFVESKNVSIIKNVLFGNAHGVNSLWSENSVVSRNKVTGNMGGGVYVVNSYNITLISNLIVENNVYGVRFMNSKNSTVIGNIIARNIGSGIHMMQSDNNIIYNNNFLYNLPNVVTTDSINFWNTDYPEGGNYWEDYNGTDVLSGVFQSTLGADGIGDTPYIIGENDIDNYPFIRPLAIVLLGDVNYDGAVNINDLTDIASHYNLQNDAENWVPELDLAPPYGKIDIFDLVTCASNYGKTFP